VTMSKIKLIIFDLDGNEISHIEIENNYHFRCKTFGDRTGNIKIFEELNKIKKVI